MGGGTIQSEFEVLYEVAAFFIAVGFLFAPRSKRYPDIEKLFCNDIRRGIQINVYLIYR
jgi:hypothetical protein